MLACGYLKIEKWEFDEAPGTNYYTLALTNKEVRIMFSKMIQDWFYMPSFWNSRYIARRRKKTWKKRLKMLLVRLKKNSMPPFYRVRVMNRNVSGNTGLPLTEKMY